MSPSSIVDVSPSVPSESSILRDGGGYSVPGRGGIAIRWLVVVWLAGITLLFHHQEGFLPVSWLFGESLRPGLTWVVFDQAVTQSWGIAGPIPWAGMAGAVAMGGGALVLGMIWVRGLGLRGLTLIEWGAIGYGFGLGLVAIPTSLLAMAGLLRFWPILLLWVALMGLGLMLAGRRQLQEGLPMGAFWLQRPACRGKLVSWQARAFATVGWVLIAGITLLTFAHGVGQGETYWDSLILYLGYARMMLEEGGVVRRVVGQVGIGLGANYPHLFEFFAAQTGALFGGWDDQHAQWMAPCAGLAATLLIYRTVLRLSGSLCGAVAAALAFRAYPSSIIYTQYASPYALAILAVAALVFLGVLHHQQRDRASLAGMLMVAAIACHINFLMIVLTPVTLLFLCWPVDSADWRTALSPRRLTSRLGWPLVVSIVVASPWFIRNWVVTGNPVYAFFPGVLGGIHINPEVMESAVEEWRANGDGLHVLGPSLLDKIRGLPVYFVTGRQAWKTAPVLVAWAWPGFLLAAGLVLVACGRREWHGPLPGGHVPWPPSVLLMLTVLFLGFWTYAFVVADYYLYQIVPVSVAIGLLTGVLWSWLAAGGRPIRVVLSLLILATGLSPGISMGFMGFKLKTGSAQVPSPQVQLVAIRNLFLPKDTLYRLEYGADMDAFAGINRLASNARILTHENRHLLHRPDLQLVHLDDWEPQQVYGKPASQRQKALDNLGIGWYLYVPNEDRHRVNAQLGMDELIRLGYWREVDRWPASRSSLPGSPVTQPGSPIGRDHQVLFERTTLAP